MLCGCSWFRKPPPPPPEPTRLVVTGAPVGSLVFVDGAQVGQAIASAERSQVFDIAPGMHVVEVRVGDRVPYREQLYVEPEEQHTVFVLSGRGN
jgi:hypothetical protein